jgi:hypothetical protein
MKTIALIMLAAGFSMHSYGQQSAIYTKDIRHFWQTYDSVKKVTDTALQQEIINNGYFGIASDGLKEFIQIRHWTVARFQKSIDSHDLFWKTVKPRTLHLQNDSVAIADMLRRYTRLYPDFKTPEIFFVISPISTGGTTTQHHVLIGTEIAAGDSSVDATGLNPFLQDFFRTNIGVTELVAHELTHTQQKGGDMEDRRNTDLLGFCLAEGMCDFIAELLLRRPLVRPYITYGKAHERSVWAHFTKAMGGKDVSDWLYNGGTKKEGDADLGYFVGYAICRAYYDHAADKAAAIREIITLDLENKRGLRSFLDKSQYAQGL